MRKVLGRRKSSLLDQEEGSFLVRLAIPDEKIREKDLVRILYFSVLIDKSMLTKYSDEQVMGMLLNR